MPRDKTFYFHTPLLFPLISLLLNLVLSQNTQGDNICTRDQEFTLAAISTPPGTLTLLKVTPLYRHFGTQNHEYPDIEAMIMTPDKHERFCQHAIHGTLQGSDIFNEFTGKAVIVSEDLSQSCNGRLGLFADFNHLKSWCDLNAVIIWANDPHGEYNNFIGYYYNMHDGTQFKRMYKRHPSLKECGMFEMSVNIKSEKDFMRQLVLADQSPDPRGDGDFMVDICADRDDQDIFQSWLVILLFRVIIAGLYFFVAFKSLRFLIVDFKRNFVLSNIHRATLLINFLTMTALAIAEALGGHFMFDTVSIRVQDVFFFLFFGTSVATDFLLSVLYDRVIRNMQGRESEDSIEMVRFLIFILFATSMIVTDIVAAFYQYTSSVAVYDIIYRKLPITFMALQVFVILFLIKQTYDLVKLFESSAKLAKFVKAVGDIDSKKRYSASKRLAQRFRFWVTVSVVCSSLSVMFWYFWLKQLCIKSKEAWIVLWLGLSFSKFGNVLAQVQVCIPPARKRQVKKELNHNQNEDTKNVSRDSWFGLWNKSNSLRNGKIDVEEDSVIPEEENTPPNDVIKNNVVIA